MRIKKAKRLTAEEDDGQNEKLKNRQSCKLIDTSGTTAIQEETKENSSVNQKAVDDDQFEFINSYEEDFVKRSAQKHQSEEAEESKGDEYPQGRCNSFLNTLMMENATFEITDAHTGEIIALDEQQTEIFQYICHML